MLERGLETTTFAKSKLREDKRSYWKKTYTISSVNHKVIKETYPGIWVNLNRGVKGGGFRDVVVLSFTLFFLELEGNTTDGTLLNTLHQVGREASNLVAETLGGNNSLGERDISK